MTRLWSTAALLLLVSCSTPPTDLKEWTPQDHQHNEKSGAQAKGQTTGEKKELFPGVDQVTVATWSSKCSLCHGRIGRADGPQAAMFKPKDLSDPVWQAATTDEQMLAAIQNGKGKMPAFALPPKTAEGLIRLVRVFNRDRDGSKNSEAQTNPSAAAPASTASPRKAK